MILSLEERKVKKIHKTCLIITFLMVGNVFGISPTYALSDQEKCINACQQGTGDCMSACNDLDSEYNIKICKGFCAVDEECEKLCRDYFKQ